MLRKLAQTMIALAVLALSGCGYNTLVQQDEQVKSAWSEVLNQYQRRADLVPNLVSTVKGYAQHEERVLTEVTAARARVGSLQLSPETINDAQAFAKFTGAQRELSGALTHLLAVSEAYPQLRADGAFRDLQAQLEGTENRITVARNRYIQAVQVYNVTVRQFPTNLMAKWQNFAVRPNFTVEDEKAIARPPAVNFQQDLPPTDD